MSPLLSRASQGFLRRARESFSNRLLREIIALRRQRLFKPGDYVKVEFVNQSSGESEWMWVEISSDDHKRHIVFGRLDSEPVVNTDLRRGMELAVSYDNIREHRTASSFKPV